MPSSTDRKSTFEPPPVSFQAGGSFATNSTSLWSSSGART